MAVLDDADCRGQRCTLSGKLTESPCPWSWKEADACPLRANGRLRRPGPACPLLGYELQPPPAGFPTWDDYYRDLGVPEEDLGVGTDRIFDPEGHGPRIWFQVVPETKTIKNRLHLDIHAGGGRTVPIETRRQQVDAEASRLAGLGATVARILYQERFDHYGVAMKDPEGNEFDIS